MSLPTTHKIERFYLLDLLRILFIMAIITFHANEFVFFENKNPIINQTFFYQFFDHWYARFFALAGQGIIFLVFFMRGFKSRPLKINLPLILLFIFGHILISLSFKDSISNIGLEWDIYPFLLISILVLQLLHKIKNINIRHGSYYLLSLILVIPQFVEFSGPNNSALNSILFGSCKTKAQGTWPLFPWLALPLMATLMGEWAQQLQFKIREIKKWELLLWPFLITSSLYYIFDISSYGLYQVPIGPQFYCFVLNRPFIEYIAYFVLLLFFLRVSFSSFVIHNIFIAKIAGPLSSLHWNRYFARCYIIHIALLLFAAQIDQALGQNPLYFDLYFLCIFPLSELLSRVVDITKKKLRTRPN